MSKIKCRQSSDVAFQRDSNGVWNIKWFIKTTIFNELFLSQNLVILKQLSRQCTNVF